MVQTLPPVPTTALSTLFQNSKACSIALKISSTSLPAPAGQVIPSLLFSSLVQNKVATDSGTGLAVLRACRHSGSSGCCSVNGGDDGSGGGSGGGGGGSGGGGGDGGGGSSGDDDGGCDGDGDGGCGGGGGGGGVDGGCGGNSSSYA